MKKYLIMIGLLLVFLSAGQDDASNINNLAEECSLGNEEACREIINIAKESNELNIDQNTVQKINDQEVLKEISQKDIAVSVRMIAADKLLDRNIAQSVFTEIAKNNTNLDIRLFAIDKIIDLKLLADITKNDYDVNNGVIGKLVVGKINDQFTLADIAKNSTDSEVSIAGHDKWHFWTR